MIRRSIPPTTARTPRSARPLFDKAVVCNGQTVTFNLKKPVGDFNYAVSGALEAFAPFKASQDRGDKSNFVVFSDGPYMQSGTWVDGKGGTFVRNPKYNPKTDDTSARKALFDKIVFLPSMAQETVYDRLIKDSGNDQFLVTDRVPRRPTWRGSLRSRAGSPTPRRRSTITSRRTSRG